VMYFITITGIEVGYHRYFTHRSFTAKPWVESALAIAGSMAFQGPVIWWAATHRRHHRKADAEGDPHSPFTRKTKDDLGTFLGFFHSHMGWLFEADSTRPADWSSSVHDLYKKPHIFVLHMNYFPLLGLGFVIPTVISAIAWGSLQGALLGFLWGGLVRVFVVNHLVWSLNSVCHMVGSSPFRLLNDKAKNVALLALPTMGQGWHNNHHAFPGSALVGLRWWQVDPGWHVIRLLQALGLAWDVRVPAKTTIENRARAIDSVPDHS
jgi:stearoyl-CoA desaturase (delta-9 desaturase)